MSCKLARTRILNGRRPAPPKAPPFVVALHPGHAPTKDSSGTESSDMYLKGREDVQTWKDRLLGKRIVSSDRRIVEHEGWTSTGSAEWEPRVYYSSPVGQGSEKGLIYSAQPNSPLLRLPAEIRNHILEYVLPPQMTRETRDAGQAETAEDIEDASWVNTSAIIFCCKQLFIEGRAMAVNLHTFDWECFPRKTRFCAKPQAKYDWKT